MRPPRTIRETIQGVSREVDPYDPPAELRLDAGAVSRINFQPRWCPPPLECIASRRGDVIELVFAWNIKREPDKRARWRYRLGPLVENTTIIARRIDQ